MGFLLFLFPVPGSSHYRPREVLSAKNRCLGACSARGQGETHAVRSLLWYRSLERVCTDHNLGRVTSWAGTANANDTIGISSVCLRVFYMLCGRPTSHALLRAQQCFILLVLAINCIWSEFSDDMRCMAAVMLVIDILAGPFPTSVDLLQARQQFECGIESVHCLHIRLVLG